jgi:hypothetical protein
LNKEDLWHVLDNYPESLAKIIDKGKSILRKDNLLDETLVDSKRHVEQEQLMSIQVRIQKLSGLDRSLNVRMKSFFDEYIESIRQFKQQLSQMEYHVGARKSNTFVPTRVPVSAPVVPFFLNQWKQNTAAHLMRFKSSPVMQFDDE